MTTAHLIVATGVLFYLFTCIAFIDIARKDFGSMGKKALWAFVAFLPFIGPVLYFILGYKTGKRPGIANPMV
ncbi:MAG: hypothetical protein C0403_16215 [Desulfobacterium sp.]|nr:hypothetical protein [Desulfobacterium sp.]